MSTRKPPVARMIAKDKETGEKYELMTMWANQYSDQGNYDWSDYREDEERPEGQMNRMSLATFIERGGKQRYYLNHWTMRPKKESEDIPF